MGGDGRVHKHEEMWEANRRRLLGDPEVTREAKEALVAFDAHLGAQGIGFARRAKYLAELPGAAKVMGASFCDPARADVERFLAHTETGKGRRTRRPFSEEPKAAFRILLVRFYR